MCSIYYIWWKYPQRNRHIQYISDGREGSLTQEICRDTQRYLCYVNNKEIIKEVTLFYGCGFQ